MLKSAGQFFDVGIDEPEVISVILAGGGKDYVAPPAHRAWPSPDEKGPNVAFVVDFDSPHNKYLSNHAQRRAAIIKSTLGFAERILAPGADFSFEAIGFSPAA